MKTFSTRLITIHKAGKMDLNLFSVSLVPEQTDLPASGQGDTRVSPQGTDSARKSKDELQYTSSACTVCVSAYDI
jgi:hypothetical protein